MSPKAYEMYLANNPHNESRFIDPIEPGTWLDTEFVARDGKEIVLRGTAHPLPDIGDYSRRGIELEDPSRVRVFELCRYLADVSRDQVLATPVERRISVLPEMDQILQLEEWQHPNVVDDSERPSGSETFRQLAEVIVTGDSKLYRPTLPPNTHWRNWPEGGLL